MATESSAVVRFINLAQQAHQPVRPTVQAPITSDFGTQVLPEVRRSKPSRAPLIVGALALAGGAAAGGVYLGKSGFGGPSDPSPKANAAAAPVAGAVATPDSSETIAPTPAPAPAAAAPAPAAPVPQVTSPVVSVPSDVLAATGFDIRVEPGATITLDGSLLGKAPLRVRNLQPGAHVVDIEAPAGYFSRRVEIALDSGQAKELKVSLDRIEEEKLATQPESKSTRRSRADLKRERKEKARQDKAHKAEMRAARAAAARAEKAEKAAAKSAKKSADKKPDVVAEPLPEPEAKTAKAPDPKMSAADAELEAAMADIVGKPRRKSSSPAPAALSPAASPPAASTSDKGTLMLGSKPPCDIILDGKPTGLKTPQRAMELSVGTHRVTLVNAELGLERKFKVKIAPGKTTKAIQDLTSKLD